LFSTGGFEQVALMDLVPDDEARCLVVPVWFLYQAIFDKAEGKAVCLTSLSDLLYLVQIYNTGSSCIYWSI